MSTHTMSRTAAAYKSYLAALLADIRYAEGERGIAARVAVIARYAAYWVGAVLLSAVLGAIPAFGPTVMTLALASVTLTAVTAVIGMLLYPTKRVEIVNQARTYMALTLFPAAVLGLLTTVVMSAAQSPTATSSTSTLLSVSKSALPFLFWMNILVPPFLFVKTIIGLRKLHRDHREDEETVAIYTRQDGLYE